MITIGESIKKAREERGYSQQELANITGISKPTIGGWESGRHFPTIINLIPITDAFGLTLDELVGRSKQNEGEWVKGRYNNTVSCSICGNTVTFRSKYCPECGAKMKGGE